TTFSIRFDADAVGTHQGTLTIFHSLDEDPFTLQLIGIVTPPVVVLNSVQTALDENSPLPGTFEVALAYPLSNDLTVHYTVAGTAQEGIDYESLPRSVVIPAGQTSVPILVTAIDDVTLEPNETIVVTLSARSHYALTSAKNA